MKRLCKIATLLIVSFGMLCMCLLPTQVDAQEVSGTSITHKELTKYFPSAKNEEIQKFDINLKNALVKLDKQCDFSEVRDIYRVGSYKKVKEVVVSENITLKEISTITISKDRTLRASQPYTLERSSTYVVKDVLIPVESLRFNLSCSYQYGHATDIVCTDVSPSYSSTLAGMFYSLDYSNVGKGKTGLTAWGKATFTAKLQIAGNMGVTLHSFSLTGKIRVVPTEEKKDHWYFLIYNDWN